MGIRRVREIQAVATAIRERSPDATSESAAGSRIQEVVTTMRERSPGAASSEGRSNDGEEGSRSDDLPSGGANGANSPANTCPQAFDCRRRVKEEEHDGSG